MKHTDRHTLHKLWLGPTFAPSWFAPPKYNSLLQDHLAGQGCQIGFLKAKLQELGFKKNFFLKVGFFKKRNYKNQFFLFFYFFK